MDEFLADAFEEGWQAALVAAKRSVSRAKIDYPDCEYGLKHALDDVNPVPDPPCSGQGYAHKPHGLCKGFSLDRT